MAAAQPLVRLAAFHQSRVRSQRTEGAGAAWLASRVMWLTSLPIVTVAWATGWPWLIACASGRGLTVTVTGVPGQAVTLTPVAATAAGPAVQRIEVSALLALLSVSGSSISRLICPPPNVSTG
jgi:hypothetical protein